MADDITALIRRHIRLAVDARLTALDRQAARLEQRAASADNQTGALNQRAENVERRAGLLELAAAAIPNLSFRSAVVNLPILAAGNTSVPVTFDPQFIAADYSATFTLEAGPVVLSKLTAGVLAGSRTPQGFTAVLSNTAAVSVPAGAVLHVLAWRVLGQGVH